MTRAGMAPECSWSCSCEWKKGLQPKSSSETRVVMCLTSVRCPRGHKATLPEKRPDGTAGEQTVVPKNDPFNQGVWPRQPLMTVHTDKTSSWFEMVRARSLAQNAVHA